MFTKKGKVVFQKRDFWNLDVTLAVVIHTALVKFKSREHWGIPASFTKSTVDKPDYTPEEWNESKKEWLAVIDEMIHAFSPIVEWSDRTDIEHPYDHTKDWFVDGNFKVHYKDGWTNERFEEYRRNEKEYDEADYERRLKGRTLFAEHFHSLWE